MNILKLTVCPMCDQIICKDLKKAKKKIEHYKIQQKFSKEYLALHTILRSEMVHAHRNKDDKLLKFLEKMEDDAKAWLIDFELGQKARWG